jgi:nanoRNase/pAp phosphatase (c-di-AMP/oligoRNAs hydrolase)
MIQEPIFNPEQIREGETLVKNATSCLIILPPDPSEDLVASGLGLYLTLKNSLKTVQIGCGTPLKVDHAHLFGINEVKTSVGNQNLMVSIDMREDQLNKVDYDFDENGKFVLMIQPQAGIPAPDTSAVQFSYSGANADIVFVLGVHSLEELGKIYADEKSFLDKATLISLCYSNKPSSIGTLQFHNSKNTSLAETTAYLLKSWNLTPSEDAATNLLGQISAASGPSFQSPKVSPDTFELIAFLMRAGGELGSSMANSSRFGAFAPQFGESMPAPTFDDDFEPSPFPRLKRKPGTFMPPTDFSGI